MERRGRGRRKGHECLNGVCNSWSRTRCVCACVLACVFVLADEVLLLLCVHVRGLHFQFLYLE